MLEISTRPFAGQIKMEKRTHEKGPTKERTGELPDKKKRPGGKQEKKLVDLTKYRQTTTETKGQTTTQVPKKKHRG